MNIEISNILKESSIFTLRDFGAFIGVSNSSGVKKDVLIESILGVLDNPNPNESAKKGRKHMTGLSGLLEKLEEFDEFKPHADAFDEYKALKEKSVQLADNYHANKFGVSKTPKILTDDTPLFDFKADSDFNLDINKEEIEKRELPKENIEDLVTIPSKKLIPGSTPLFGEDTFMSVSDVKSNEPKAQMECEGYLEVINGKGFGFIRTEKFDVYIAGALIQKMCLKAGDFVKALYSERSPGKYAAFFIKNVNRMSVDNAFKRIPFESLRATYPSEKFNLISDDNAVRAIDLFSPIGKGQRALIVSPPKSGKTTIIKNLAKAISKGNPETKIFILLIDERPEEVTDMQMANCGEVVFSAYDDRPDKHIKIANGLIEKAKRLVENGDDVCILMDSLTRFARAVNMSIETSGRSLSGGMDAAALQTVKTFFGCGRNTTDGGTLTLIATALVDTNSRMDDLIFEEFKGTGNSEVVLDRSLSEKRIFPAIDIKKSGTRRDELLYSETDLDSINKLRKFLMSKSKSPMENVIELFEKVDNNKDLLAKLPAWFKTIQNKRNG